jgi:hypothetical protein
MMRLEGSRLEILQDGFHRVEVRDLSGRTLWKHEGQGKMTYDLGVSGPLGSRRGMFLLTVTSPYGVSSRKLVR